MTEYEEYDMNMEEPGNEPNGKQFRIANKWLLLTYKFHLNKEEYKRWFVEKFGVKANTVKILRIAHEKADPKNPYEHSHVIVEFESQYCSRNGRTFDHRPLSWDKGEKPKDYPHEVIHPNIKPLPGKKAFADAGHYISKEDPECLDLRREKVPNLFEGVRNCKNDEEAFKKYCTKPSDASGIKVMRGVGKKERIPKRRKAVEPNHPWQIELLNLVENVDPDYRTIFWVYDKKGGAGKTCFSYYLRNKRNTEGLKTNEWYGTSDIAQEKDLAEIVRSALDAGWEEFGWIFDLKRSTEKNQGFYKCIEALKDGSVTATKYQGAEISLDTLHVIVFANYLPNVKALTVERWDIREIDQKDMSLNKLSLEKVKRKRLADLIEHAKEEAADRKEVEAALSEHFGESSDTFFTHL